MVAVLLAKGTNLRCVCILGGKVPPFAVGGKQWGEFVFRGVPDPKLQKLATTILDLQEKHWFTLLPEWQQREKNVRADYLSHVLEMRHHRYSLHKGIFQGLDQVWGPHSVDRFATSENQQEPAAPFEGRFCSQYFHPEALWTDALSLPWPANNNWVFPPVHMVARAAAQMRRSHAQGTLIAPEMPLASWWESLWKGIWGTDLEQDTRSPATTT